MAPIDLSAYKNLYLESSRDYLEMMKKNLATLNSDPTNKKAMYELFRGAHSLKSQNYAMGYKNTADLCKTLEDFFQKIYEGNSEYFSSLSQSISTVLLQIENNLDHISRRNTEIISINYVENTKHTLRML